MKPQHLVKLIFAFLLTSSVFLASCKKESPYVYPNNGTPGSNATLINVYVTGAAASSAFSKLNLDIQGMEYNFSNEAGTMEGWEKANLAQAGPIDMMSIINGTTLRLNSDLIPGDIKQLRLILGDNNSIEVDSIPRVLQVSPELKETGFVIYTEAPDFSNFLNSLTLSFDVTSSLAHDPNTDEYALVPVVSCFDDTKTGSIDGFVSPADAKARIHLQADPNSRTVLSSPYTIADGANAGYFKFVGIPEGTYTVEMMAADGTNRTKILTSVAVSIGGTTNTGTSNLE